MGKAIWEMIIYAYCFAILFILFCLFIHAFFPGFVNFSCSKLKHLWSRDSLNKKYLYPIQ